MTAVAFEDAKDARREEYESRPTLSHNQIKKFKKEVREVVLRLVNEFGVNYRLQKDGQHLMLYSGDRTERPFKVAASRPIPNQLRYLSGWINDHVPQFYTEKEEPVAQQIEELSDDDPALAANQDPDEPFFPKPTEVFPPKPTLVEKYAEPEWEPYVYGSGRESEFLQVSKDARPKRMRCTYPECDYTREDSFSGAHLHEAKHTGEMVEMQEKGREARRLKVEKDSATLAEALDILLKPHGYVAIRKEQIPDRKVVDALIAENESLKAENERLRTELDEIKTKFDLAREAFGL